MNPFVESERERANPGETRGWILPATLPPAWQDNRFDHIAFAGMKTATSPLRKPAVPPRPEPGSHAIDFERQTPEAPGCADPAESALIGAVIARAGLRRDGYRLGPLIRRLPACLRALRVGSVAEARSLLDRQPELWQRALDSLLIGTTGFFRDTPVFECLRTEAIPSLLESHPHPRVWSAACSNGAELYSVAAAFAEQGPLERGQFLGTDCRITAVEIARRGEYPASCLREIPSSLRNIAMNERKGSIFIHESVKSAARWETGDLLHGGIPEGPWHMILCRNLAIYLGIRPAERLWARLAKCLAPGGYLIVGKAEKPRGAGLHREAPCIYRKTASPSTTA